MHWSRATQSSSSTDSDSLCVIALSDCLKWSIYNCQVSIMLCLIAYLIVPLSLQKDKKGREKIRKCRTISSSEQIPLGMYYFGPQMKDEEE